MSLAEEMLDTIPSSEKSDDFLKKEEGHIVINDSRQAIVPAELKTIAVTGDKDIKTITFDCVRFWDGNDLSTFAIYLNYVLPDLTTGTYIPEKITTSDGDEFYHFDWEIKKDITKKSGKITFAITAVKTKLNDEGENVVDKQWGSLPNGDCYIALGIDISNVPSEEESSDVLAQMSAILEKMREDFDEWLNNNLVISQTTGDSETAVMSQAATTLELNQLSEEIADLTDRSHFKKREELYWNTKGIITNVVVGDVVDITPSSVGFSHIIAPCNKGDVFILTGLGGASPRLWTFTDSDYVLISKSGSEAKGTNLELTAPRDGYLIVNAVSQNENYPKSLIKYIYTTVKEEVCAIHNRVYTQPMVEFTYNYDMKDVSADVSTMNFESVGYVNRLHTLFDGLVLAYPEYVSKYDVAELTGISYPDYANGITGNDVYDDTAEYKMYMYKFSCSNAGAGNGRDNKKAKLLIISGVHGIETAAPFNTYLFAKQLCSDFSADNIFKFRSVFDIYIIPCVNGYGLEHYTRKNANSIDLNRNFPVENWTQTANGSYWSGEVAGSEFETQAIMAIFDKLKPEFAVDHHNYHDEAQQFYTEVTTGEMLRLSHQSLVDCSFAFIKNFPQYFGTGFQLFTPDSDISSAPNQISEPRIGTANMWFWENGAKASATIEIAHNIRYVEGVPKSTYTDRNGNTTFAVADYTLKNQLYRYGQYVLKQLKQQ